MKHDPINMNKLTIRKDSLPKVTMARAKTLVEKEARGNRIALVKGQIDLIPSKIITGVVVYIKRKRVFTPVEIGVLASIVEASMMTIPLISTV